MARSCPDGTACIFMANHVSNLDPPILLPLIPGRTSVYLKRSLMNIPVLGYGMKLGDFIPVDRDGRLESAKESVRVGVRVLKSGLHVMTFVEGTRSRTGRLQSFKKGPFHLAMESGAPVSSRFDLGHGKHDEKGWVDDYSRRGPCSVPWTALAARLCEPGGTACRDQGGRSRPDFRSGCNARSRVSRPR